MFAKLAVCMTNKCNAACEMCCFECSPKKNETLTTEQIKSALLQAHEAGGFTAVGFTGGEAFLYYDRLLECCEYAKSLGLRVTVNSNGFWGRDESSARKKVEALKNAGVELIAFSCDRYHQEFVPLEDLRTALRVTYECGVASAFSVMETVDSDDLEKFTEALRPEIYQTTVSPHPMLPVGRALENFSDRKFLRFFETEEAKCTYMGMLQLGYDGCYYLCCSQFCHDIPRINLGRADEVHIKDLPQKVASDDFLYVMLRRGFVWYIELAKKYGFEIPDYLCSPCHCCYYVFRNKELMEKIKSDVEEEAGRLRVQHLLNC